MSNLLKVGTTISKSERIIDYNDIIKDRVEAARAAKRQKADSDGFIYGLNADVVERLPEDEINTEAAASEEITQESAEAARAEAEEILAQAKAQAEENQGFPSCIPKHLAECVKHWVSIWTLYYKGTASARIYNLEVLCRCKYIRWEKAYGRVYWRVFSIFSKSGRVVFYSISSEKRRTAGNSGRCIILSG